jgi:hypothetical protein
MARYPPGPAPRSANGSIILPNIVIVAAGHGLGSAQPLAKRLSLCRGGYSAPMTLKSWLTKTWCGQLTPM